MSIKERTNILLTQDEASNINFSRLPPLLSEYGVQALREGLISIEEASNINTVRLPHLLEELIDQNNNEKPSYGG